MIVDEKGDSSSVETELDATENEEVDTSDSVIAEAEKVIEVDATSEEVIAEPCFENTDAEELEFSGDELEVLKTEKSEKKKSKPKRRDSRKAKKAKDVESSEDDEDDFDNLGDLSDVDDPLAPAFDLERGAPLPVHEEMLPWKSKVANAKEFFNAEILYRFDIIEPSAVKPLKGSYRIELDGDGGGVWSINIDSELDVTNSSEKADTILSLHRRDFLDIVNGKLNPQLAILSKKIKVKGNVRKAIQLQEVLSPSSE